MREGVLEEGRALRTGGGELNGFYSQLFIYSKSLEESKTNNPWFGLVWFVEGLLSGITLFTRNAGYERLVQCSFS